MAQHSFRFGGGVLAALLTLTAATAQAQDTASPMQAAPQAVEWVRGSVVQADAVRGWITLRHEAIKSIDMDAMTMPFKVKDPESLAGLKRGDRVLFHVGVEGNDLLILQIKPGRKGSRSP
jgi:Cu(I)/Ag(I) efflux system protein CusF